MFDEVEERRFGKTYTEYKEWAVDRLQDHHTTTVTYTGDKGYDDMDFRKELRAEGICPLIKHCFSVA
jgi:restriction endonuclease Mrr